MYETLLQEFHQFITTIKETSFQDIQQKFTEKQSSDPLSKFVRRYVPQLVEYQPEFDTHNQHQQLKLSPSFDKKRTFQNTDNLHRQVISLFKSFLLSQMTDLRDYLRLSVDIDQLSKMLSRIQVLRYSQSEFNIIYYLFTGSKRGIRLFIRLREEILKQSALDKNSFLLISTHNSAKYAPKEWYLGEVKVSRKKKQWEHLISVAGFQYNDQFAQITFSSRDQIFATELIQYCLWINKQTAQYSPKK